MSLGDVSENDDLFARSFWGVSLVCVCVGHGPLSSGPWARGPVGPSDGREPERETKLQPKMAGWSGRK